MVFSMDTVHIYKRFCNLELENSSELLSSKWHMRGYKEKATYNQIRSLEFIRKQYIENRYRTFEHIIERVPNEGRTLTHLHSRTLLYIKYVTDQINAANTFPRLAHAVCVNVIYEQGYYLSVIYKHLSSLLTISIRKRLQHSSNSENISVR